MFCPNCGTKIDDGAVFCPECGTRLAAAAAPVAAAAVAADDEMTVSLEPEEEAPEQLPETAEEPAEYAEEPQEEANGEEYPEQQNNYEEQPADQPEELPEEQPVYVEEEQPEHQQEEQPVYHQEEQPVYPPNRPEYNREEPPVYTPPVYQGGNEPQQPVYEGPIESQPVKLLKKSARSGAFLIAIILFTIFVGLTIFTIFQNRITSESVDTMISDFGDAAGEEIADASEAVAELFGGTIDSFGDTVLLTSLLAMVPAVLTLVALWIIFGCACGKNNERMGTAGFTIIKVIWIIKLILTSILVLAVIVLGVISYTALRGSMEDILDKANEVPYIGEQLSKISGDIAETLPMVLLCSLGVFAAISAVVILFQVKIITTLGAAQRTAETGDNRRKASAFAAVMLFIIAFYALHALPAAIIAVILLPSQLFSLIAMCAEIGAYICFGIAIFSYRVKVRILNITGVIE